MYLFRGTVRSIYQISLVYTYLLPYKTHRWTDRPTHGQAQTNMPPQLLSALHDHVMSLNAQIREKHQA